MSFGVSDINRQIHERFHKELSRLGHQWRFRSIPKPMGAERVVYGDKVINLSNHTRDGKKGLSATGGSWLSGEWGDWSYGWSMEDQRFPRKF